MSYEHQEIVNYYIWTCKDVTGIDISNNASQHGLCYDSGGIVLNVELTPDLEMRCEHNVYRLATKRGVIKTWTDKNYEKVIRPNSV